MKNFINRVKHSYTLENIKYMYSVRPVVTVFALAADVLIIVAVVVAVYFVGSVVI